MEAVPQAAFWLSLAMLGLVGVVYALGYPYLASIRDVADWERRLRRAAAAAERTVIAEKLRDMRADVASRVEDTARRLLRREKELARTINTLETLPRIFNVTEAVFKPACAFLTAYVTATIATLLAGQQLLQREAMIAFAALSSISSISGIGIAWGFYQIVRYLLALQLLSELLTPVVTTSVNYSDRWRAGELQKITISAKLERGRPLHSFQILLYVPPEVSSKAAFNPKLRVAEDDPIKPSYNCIPSKEFEVLKRNLEFTYDFHGLSCMTPGTLKFYYMVLSEEYVSDEKELAVSVS